MQEEKPELRIVHIMEPTLCLACQFAAIARVKMESGTTRRMLHCKRLFCDNWDIEESGDSPIHIQASEQLRSPNGDKE